jgi:hypothetical protein
MESVNYIITAKHYAAREGAANVYERILKLAKKMSQRGTSLQVAGPDARGFAVFAEIDFGQWLAHCECGGAEMVDPNEPIFFCFGCGNRANDGYLRPVIFPKAAERAKIERLVLERPVDDLRGLDDLDRAYQAKPVLFAQIEGELRPLSRSWKPGESLDELKRQNKAVATWRKFGGDNVL